MIILIPEIPPLCRWVVGPTHTRGLDILKLSVTQMRKLYPELDLVVSFNQIDPYWLKELRVELHQQTGCELRLEPILNDTRQGVSWKLYPPRLRKSAHEIIMDNDVVLFERIPEIDKFLRSRDRALTLQAYHRNYGQFDGLIDDFRINTGIYGLPPEYDFKKEVDLLLEGRRWSNRGDEQGVVATCLQKLNPFVIPYNTVVPLDDKAEFIRRHGAHFIHANTAEEHLSWDSYNKIGIFIIVGEGREEQLRTTMSYLDRVTPGIERLLITDGDIDVGYLSRPLYRNQKLFSFPDAIYTGFSSVKSDIPIYLDCDRIPDPAFFDAARTLRHGQLIACKNLYFVDTISSPQHTWQEDFRIEDVSIKTTISRKNVMSGCVAMRKSTFEAIDIDRSFVGCGFIDYDLAMSAQSKGFEIILLNLVERHLKHPPSESTKKFKLHNAWNGVRFYDKWGLEINEPILRLVKQLGIDLDEMRRHTLDYLVDKYA